MFGWKEGTKADQVGLKDCSKDKLIFLEAKKVNGLECSKMSKEMVQGLPRLGVNLIESEDECEDNRKIILSSPTLL